MPEYLSWKPVMQVVQSMRAAPGLEESEVPDSNGIGDFLHKHFNVDVTDRRQLNYLIQCMGMYTPPLVQVAAASSQYRFFGLDEMQTGVLALAVLHGSATFVLALSEHLPPEVRKGELKRELSPSTSITPSTFKWSAFVPAPGQVEHHDGWRKEGATRATPGFIAEQDQAAATLRDYLANDVFAYMSTVAQFCIMSMAIARLDPDDPYIEGALRFRDVVLVTMYNQLPSEYRKIAEGAS